MNHIVGSAVTISSEIESALVTGTTITLVSITNPNGVTSTLNTAMTFADNIASTTYQTSSSDAVGRYKYLVKSVNGSYTNYANGYFNLEAQ